MWHRITIGIGILMEIMFGIVDVYADCGTLPAIKHSVNNMTDIYIYHESDAATFYCLPGYRPEGNATYVCSDGEWIGGSFSCPIKKCPSLGSPINGKRIGDSYEVGSVMRFKCDTGYDMIGLNTSQCQTNAKWQPPKIPECRIKKCPAVPSIKHGNVIVEHPVNDQNDVYGTVLKVQCLGNFIINGHVRVYCTNNGRWTKKPKCESVPCPPYPGLDSECVLKSKLEASNTLLFLYCTEHSTKKGNESASCNNNAWDDLSMKCVCADCEVKANPDLVRLDNLNPNGLLKHGETLKWSCKNGSTEATTAPLICIDGTLETPLCSLDDIPLTSTANPINETDKESIDMLTTKDDDKEKTVPVWAKPLIAILVIVVCVIVIVCIIVKYRKGNTSNEDSNEPSDIEANTDLVQNEEQQGAGVETPLFHDESSQNGAASIIQEITKKKSKDEKELEREQKRLYKCDMKARVKQLRVAKLEEKCKHPNTKTKSYTSEQSPLINFKTSPEYEKNAFLWGNRKKKKNERKTKSKKSLTDSQDDGVNKTSEGEVEPPSVGPSPLSTEQDDGACANADMRDHNTETFKDVAEKIPEGEAEPPSVGPSPLSTEQDDGACANTDMRDHNTETFKDVAANTSEGEVKPTSVDPPPLSKEQDYGACANADMRDHNTETFNNVAAKTSEGEVELADFGPSPLSTEPEHNLLQDSICTTPRNTKQKSISSGKSKGQRDKVTERLQENRRSYRIKNECPNCLKTVLPAELIRACGRVWHKNCFKCYTCKNPLACGTVTEHDDQIYCGSCHSKQFGRKRTTLPI